MTIQARVMKITAEHLGVSADGLSLATKFTDDLGADSLDMIELLMGFEEEFSIETTDDDVQKIITIGDAVQYITGLGVQ